MPCTFETALPRPQTHPPSSFAGAPYDRSKAVTAVAAEFPKMSKGVVYMLHVGLVFASEP